MELSKELCAHLKDAVASIAPKASNGCEECLQSGEAWVQLRLCLTCGHVGCCDSSKGEHATAHFRSTNHPVIKSFEPGDTWQWCYIHEQMATPEMK